MLKDIKYKALVAEEKTGKFIRTIKTLSAKDLPQNKVLVKVLYSSLNYKDSLSASGNKGITKKYPHTPGIDAAGIVEESSDSSFKKGDEVIVTNYDLGMNTSGGFGQYIRVPEEWIVKLPENMTLRESMMYGTGGFTAALSVLKLIDHGITPEKGKILVTGASGGVGSIAVSILSKSGYSVAAVSGLEDESEYLKSIGAEIVITPDEFLRNPDKPLLKTKWAAAIDNVGGSVLDTAVKTVFPHSIVTTCGKILPPELKLTVYPFILRGVTLAGIDAQSCPLDYRVKTWKKLADDWKIEGLESIIKEISLEELNEEIELMIKGRGKGRKIINLWK